MLVNGLAFGGTAMMGGVMGVDCDGEFWRVTKGIVVAGYGGIGAMGRP